MSLSVLSNCDCVIDTMVFIVLLTLRCTTMHNAKVTAMMTCDLEECMHTGMLRREKMFHEKHGLCVCVWACTCVFGIVVVVVVVVVVSCR